MGSLTLVPRFLTYPFAFITVLQAIPCLSLCVAVSNTVGAKHLLTINRNVAVYFLKLSA